MGRLLWFLIVFPVLAFAAGPVRGDVFWGFGAEAQLRAGLMKQRGRYFAL